MVVGNYLAIDMVAAEAGLTSPPLSDTIIIGFLGQEWLISYGVEA